MRVLQLTGPMEGGMRRHVEALLAGMPSEGVTCGLAGPTPPCEPAGSAGPGVPWIRLPLTDQMASALDPRTVLALRSAWRRGNWDLLHAHGYKAALLARAAAAIAPRLRYVVTLHNLCPRTGPGARLLLGAALGGARRQIAISAAVLESQRAAGIGARRPILISNGVDWQRFASLPEREAARRALGVSEAAAVLFLGRLTEEKGVHVLAEAASQLQERRVPCAVLIGGQGPERRRLEAAARELALLSLLGQRDDVPSLMSACDVVVIPSLREGQSLVALEAMAAGRPLVVSDVGGLAELAAASGAAWSVPPGDAGALAAALERLFAEPEARAALAARGQEYARSVGSWDRMVREVAAVYRAALAER